MTDTPKLWERQPTDTDKSFDAFCVYRDMGRKRSLEKVAEKLGKSTSLINRWSSEHNWVNRKNAYEQYMRDLLREQIENERLQIQADALADYKALRKAIKVRLQILADMNYKSPASDLHQLISLMEHANSYARLNSGLPDKITESNNTNTQSGSLDLNLSMPELPKRILDKFNDDQ